MLALACLIVLPFMTEAKTLLVETKSIVKPPIRSDVYTVDTLHTCDNTKLQFAIIS